MGVPDLRLGVRQGAGDGGTQGIADRPVFWGKCRVVGVDGLMGHGAAWHGRRVDGKGTILCLRPAQLVSAHWLTWLSTDLGKQPVIEGSQPFCADCCQLPADPGPKPAAKRQELGLEMIQRIGRVIQRPDFRRWITRLIDGRPPRAGKIHASRNADETDRVQPVGILENPGLDTHWFNGGGKAMRLNGVTNLLDAAGRPSNAGKHLFRLQRRKARRKAAVGRCLVHPDTIMKQSRRQQEFEIAALLRHDFLDVFPDP